MRFLSSLRTEKFFLGFIVVLLLLSVPVTLYVVRSTQESRTHAAASTKLYFLPASSTASPIQKNVGDTFSLDLMADPGSNLVTSVRFIIQFDPTKIALATNPFVTNSQLNLAEGPVASASSIAAAVSVGSDPTKALSTPTKIGTLTFKTLAATNQSPTIISFDNTTLVLSTGPSEQATENVLSTTEPALITIGSQTTTITPSTTLSPQPTVVSTMLSFTLLLHGIGSSGDNSNPTNASLSNKNPLHPQRNIEVWIYDSNNKLVTSTTGSVNYDTNAGAFLGSVDLGASFASGDYNIKIKSDRYLRKLVAGIQQIKNLQTNPVPNTQMVAGDINGDNNLDVLDYNALLDCGYGDISPLPMLDPNATFNTQVCKAHTPAGNVDLDDNGIIDGSDYNLFLRELAVQNGD